jgi:hypothetical protein
MTITTMRQLLGKERTWKNSKNKTRRVDAGAEILETATHSTDVKLRNRAVAWCADRGLTVEHPSELIDIKDTQPGQVCLAGIDNDGQTFMRTVPDTMTNERVKRWLKAGWILVEKLPNPESAAGPM